MKLIFILPLLLFAAGMNNYNPFIPEGKKDIVKHHAVSALANQAKNYAASKGLNTNHYFFVDMSKGSGTERFFIYNFKSSSVEASGLVTHGRCNEYCMKGRRYSNVAGSGCTSFGRYKIGKPYYGRFGLAYKLYGMDSTNSNAYKRFVVLHAHECVPATDVYPQEICQSDGCPTVSPAFLQKLAAIINASKKPVLLWIHGG